MLIVWHCIACWCAVKKLLTHLLWQWTDNKLCVWCLMQVMAGKLISDDCCHSVIGWSQQRGPSAQLNMSFWQPLRPAVPAAYQTSSVIPWSWLLLNCCLPSAISLMLPSLNWTEHITLYNLYNVGLLFHVLTCISALVVCLFVWFFDDSDNDGVWPLKTSAAKSLGMAVNVSDWHSPGSPGKWPH